MIELREIRHTSLKEAQETVIRHGDELFTYWDEGTSRYVYVNEDKTRVLKVEKDTWRASDSPNINEFAIYVAHQGEDMAETELVDGVIIQEFVMPIKWGGRALTIAQRKFALSCRNEVGWKGDKLVCFDLDEYKKY